MRRAPRWQPGSTLPARTAGHTSRPARSFTTNPAAMRPSATSFRVAARFVWSCRRASIAWRWSAARSPSRCGSGSISPPRVPSPEPSTCARWAQMSALGWYSADMHTHRPLGDTATLLEAEDLNVMLPITPLAALRPGDFRRPRTAPVFERGGRIGRSAARARPLVHRAQRGIGAALFGAAGDAPRAAHQRSRIPHGGLRAGRARRGRAGRFRKSHLARTARSCRAGRRRTGGTGQQSLLAATVLHRRVGRLAGPHHAAVPAHAGGLRAGRL